MAGTIDVRAFRPPTNPFPAGSMAAALFGDVRWHWQWWWRSQRLAAKGWPIPDLVATGELGLEIIRRIGFDEADQFFTDSQGVYRYDITKRAEAHANCLIWTRKAMVGGRPVVVANTFVRHKEMHPYYELASELDYRLQVIICQALFDSIHQVPHEVIAIMRREFEY